MNPNTPTLLELLTPAAHRHTMTSNITTPAKGFISIPNPDPQDVLDYARSHNWTAEQLAICFRSMSLTDAQMLLNDHTLTLE